jgi:hypothetical protein
MCEPNNWIRVAREMGTRTDVQCRHRYMQMSRMRRAPKAKRPLLPSIADVLTIANMKD